MRKKLFLFGFLGLLGLLVMQRDLVFAKGVEVYLNRKKISTEWEIESLEAVGGSGSVWILVVAFRGNCVPV